MCETNENNLAGMHQRLSSHLAANGDVSTLSKQFGALNSNLNRVNFALDLLNKYEIRAKFVKDVKDNGKAKRLRDEGNEFFKKKQLKEAWTKYTESVMCAEMNSTDLALAFANRSAVLFEMELYNECLQDIQNAFSNNYPGNLHAKLIARQDKASKLCKRLPSQIYHQPIPLILEENETIECASNCIEIKNGDQLLGRHIVATRDIQPGEILAIEQPFALVVVNRQLNHCHQCLNISLNPLPCNNCTLALYCGDECKSQAFHTFHKYECKILASLKSLDIDKLKMIAMKISLLSLINNQEDIRDNNDNYYYSGRYKELDNLIANTSRRSVSDLFHRATNAAIIYMLIENHTDFFTDYPSESTADELKSRLLLHLQTGPSNFHQITELIRNDNGVFVPDEVASGAFAFLSMFNHACSPNVARFCYGNSVVVRAIDVIRKGEQCFDNYGYDYGMTPKNERLKHLKDQYYFDCVCEACRNNWNLFDNLQHLDSAPDINEEIFQNLSQANINTALEVLDDLIDDLKISAESRPSKNYCRIKEMVKQCFAIFGTKNVYF